MGLTIHYELHTPAIETLADAKKLIAKLRGFARKLPVKECTKIITWVAGKDDELPFLPLFSGILPLDATRLDDAKEFHFVEPLELVMFGLRHPGSETAFFGLARYPLTFSVPEKGIRNRRTGLTGWRWRQSCKTQYASMPKEGGWENFLAIHDAICRTVDEAARLKMRVKVVDEGKYWDDRDAAKLRATVEKWNQMVAAFVGHMKDRLPGQKVEAAITEEPTFEHMEAKGRKLFKMDSDDAAEES